MVNSDDDVDGDGDDDDQEDGGEGWWGFLTKEDNFGNLEEKGK